MASHILMSRLYDSGTCKRRRYFCRISTSSLDVETSKNLYPPSPEKNPKVCASSSDGLLCLEYYVYDKHTYIVWNPSSNEFRSVPDCLEPTSPCPESRTSYDHRDHGCSPSTHAQLAFGLGFDHKSNDYKFIQFLLIDYCDNRDDCHSSALQVAVYSLKNNSWKDITIAWHEAFPDLVYYPCFYVYDATDVSGRLYWLISFDDIISFDLADEEFSTLPFPNVCGISHPLGMSLMELHGALTLVSYRRSGVDSLFVFCVWETETETWTRKTCYEFCTSSVHRPMGFCRNYELFLLQGLDGKLLVYDYTLGELKKIHQIYDYPGTNYLKKLFPYVENTITFDQL